MADIQLDDVQKTYGEFSAVNGVSLHVAAGEFVTLLGPSGCGKTTCLRIIAGFVKPSAGRVSIGGRDVTDIPPYRRNTGMVFQNYALFPHKSVAANVAFGMKVRGVGRGEIRKRTAEALNLVQLNGFADRFPAELSGGQRQRVALARAVVIKPQVLLLDEPLGALDLKLREELQVEIKRVQSALGITTLFVTHDQGEALGMSDRIAVMRDGKIVQVDSPQALYRRPNSRYVANFVGRTNLIEASVQSRSAAGGYLVESAGPNGSIFEVDGKQHADFIPGERCLLAARPENFSLSETHRNTIRAKVVDVTYRGSWWNIELCGAKGESFSALLPQGAEIPNKDETVPLSCPPAGFFLLKIDETPC